MARSVLYLLSIALVIGWIIGVFVFHQGGLFHLMLVAGVVALIFGFTRRGVVD